MRWIAGLLLVGTLLASDSNQPARADAKADAEFVGSKFLTDKSIDTMFSAMGPLIRQALSNSLSQGAAKNLSQTSREIVIEEFIKGFKTKFAVRFRSHNEAIYLKTMTAAELSDLRKFLETPSGKAFASKQHLLMTRGSAIGQQLGQEIGGEINKEIGARLAKHGAAFIPNTSDRDILLRMFPNR